VILEPFAGPGGTSHGLALIGRGDSVGIELDPDACRTATAAGHARIRADVATFPLDHLAGRVEGVAMSPPCTPWSKAGKRLGLLDQDRIYAHLDQVAAAGRWVPYGMDGWNDPRSPLVLEPVRWADTLRPQWLVCEQVPDVLPLWRRIATWLRTAGYTAVAGVLSAERYGVAQTRQRAFLVAARDGRRVALPAPTHARYVPGRRADEPADGLFDAPARERAVSPGDRGLLPWVSMADALGWDVDRPARTVCGDRGPRWAYGQGAASYGTGWTLQTSQVPDGTDAYQRRSADHPSPTVGGAGMSWLWQLETEQRSETVDGRVPIVRGSSAPAPTMVANSDRWEWSLLASGREKVNDRTLPRSADQPSMTVAFGHSDMLWIRGRPATNVCGDPRVAGPGHRDREGGERQYDDQTVRLTIEQAGVLQSFPADWPWRGTKSARFQQAGNAVPPLLMAAVAGELLGVDWRRGLWGLDDTTGTARW
jgi:DNA (cytosine-5)-methyltransferase 1